MNKKLCASTSMNNTEGIVCSEKKSSVELFTVIMTEI